MHKSQVLARIKSMGILPVVRADSAEQASRAAQAILEGGVDALEITMTVPGAIQVIEKLVQTYGDKVLVGAGTVLDPETARACILAGAQFVVSPALNCQTIELCRRYGIAVMPGALTPTEVVTAWEAGADLVKIFPCGALGGASYIKSLKAPLPQIEMIPTGGVNLKTAEAFLTAGSAALGVGADLVDPAAMASGNWEVLTARAKDFRAIVTASRG